MTRAALILTFLASCSGGTSEDTSARCFVVDVENLEGPGLYQVWCRSGWEYQAGEIVWLEGWESFEIDGEVCTTIKVTTGDCPQE